MSGRAHRPGALAPALPLLAAWLLAACAPATLERPGSSPTPPAPLSAPSPSAGVPTPLPTAPPPAEGWVRYLGVNQVHGLAWAADGSLWTATTGGAAHWDLVTGTFIQHTAENGLGSNYANDVAVAPDGSVWVATLAGVSRLAEGTWTAYTPADGLAGIPVQSIAVAPGGEVWAGTLAGVSRFDGHSWTSYLAGERAWQVAVAADGSIWAANDGAGVSRYAPEDRAWTTFGAGQGLPRAGVKAVAVSPDGEPWIYIGHDQVYRHDGAGWEEVPGIGAPWVLDIAFDAGGGAWIATGPGLHGGGYGLLAPRGDSWERITTEQGLGSNTVYAVAPGPKGTIAAGTEQGVSLLQDGQWRTLRGGPARNLCTAVAVAPDGAVWAGHGDYGAYASGGGVARFDGEGWDYFLGDENVTLLAVDPQGVLWAGAGCGLWRWDGQVWQSAGGGCDALMGRVVDLAFGSGGAVWVASGMKLARLHGQAWTTYDRYASSVAVEPGGAVWISGWKGTQGSEYTARFDGSAWIEYPGNLTSLTAMPDGQVWALAPGKGLARFDGQSWALDLPFSGEGETSGGGPGLDSIDRVVAGPGGTLWASGGGSLAKLDGGAWHLYSGAGANAIAFAPDGSLWLATSNGIVHWQPDLRGP